MRKLQKQDRWISKLKFDEKGLIPAISVSYDSGDVLMLAYMNMQSIQLTLQTGFVHYWSRSRQEIWKKGETSGHLQKLKNIYVDCDYDTLKLEIEQIGPACHTGSRTCFFNILQEDGDLKAIEDNK